MALDTWGGIKTAVTNWLARSDLAARYPEWCSLAEADMRRKLRSPILVTTASMVVGVRDLTLAVSTYQEIDHVRYQDGYSNAKGVLTKVSAEQLQERRRDGSGAPLYYSINAPSGNNPVLSFDIAPDIAYNLTINAYHFTALNTSGDINTTTLLLKAPDLYLYGILCQSAPYLEHDERIQTWQALYQNALDGENLATERLLLGGGAKPISLPVVFG